MDPLLTPHRMTPHFDHELRADSESGLLDAAKLFLCQRVFAAGTAECWTVDQLTAERCTDGITNKLVKVTNNATGQAVLLRVYGAGTDVLIDRAQELRTMRMLSEMRQIPPVYATFSNGLCYGFIPGRVLSPAELSSFYPLITRQMAAFHRAQPPSAEEGGTDAWVTIERWLTKVPKTYADPARQKIFQSRTFLSVDALRAELADLKCAVTEACTSPIVFCHNDLLSANIIYQPPTTLSPADNLHNIDDGDETENVVITPGDVEPPTGDAQEASTVSRVQALLGSTASRGPVRDGKVTFIDYEYGSMNMRGFDIGNHFNEFAGFECDYSRYPEKSEQLRWLCEYLRAYNSVKPTGSEVDELYREVNKYALVSHFFWAVWALVQASMSDLEFDYMGYATLRLDEYFARKPEFLAL